MSISHHRARPLPGEVDDATEVQTQFGALCWRMRKDEVQVLLVTTRSSRRWVPPKGWPMPDRSPAEAAAQEAYEEAGVEGKPQDICLGVYPYIKDIGQRDSQPCVIALFPVRVKTLLGNWPEAGQRRRKWFSRKKAAAKVQEPELRQLIRDFDPRKLK